MNAIEIEVAVTTNSTNSEMLIMDMITEQLSPRTSLDVAQPVAKSPITVLASYGQNELVKATNLGANYAFSKNTSLQARYIKENNVVNAKDLRRVAVGMEMNF